jgi:hypothetical protein
VLLAGAPPGPPAAAIRASCQPLGGGDGLPAYTSNAFEGAGILVFLSAAAILALVTLPFTSERPIGLDRWLSYLITLAVGFVGLVLRLAVLLGDGLAAIRPDHGPVVTALGLIGLAWAVFEIHEEPEPR